MKLAMEIFTRIFGDSNISVGHVLKLIQTFGIVFELYVILFVYISQINPVLIQSILCSGEVIHLIFRLFQE